MAKLVSNAPNITPGLIGTKPICIIPKADRRLGDDLQFPFDGSDGHRT